MVSWASDSECCVIIFRLGVWHSLSKLDNDSASLIKQSMKKQRNKQWKNKNHNPIKEDITPEDSAQVWRNRACIRQKISALLRGRSDRKNLFFYSGKCLLIFRDLQHARRGQTGFWKLVKTDNSWRNRKTKLAGKKNMTDTPGISLMKEVAVTFA